MDIGFIGCGGFVGGTHIPNAARNPNFKLRAFCDLNEKILGGLKAKYAPEYVTTCAEELFNDPNIAMVICGTKPDYRLPIMRLAAKTGKPLFVEKPLCYREEEIPEMLRLIAESGIKFMVGFNRPYSPMARDMKTLFDQYRRDNTTIIYRVIGEAGLWPFHHYDAIVNKKESTIIHEATHFFDLLNWLTGSLPFRVFTAGGGNMDNVITLEYPERTTAVIVSGDNATAGWPKERLEIDTGAGVIVGTDFASLSVAGFPDHRYFYKNYDYAMAGKTLNTSLEELQKNYADWRRSVTDEERKYGYYYDRAPKVNKGHYDELEFFRLAIENDTPVQTGVKQGAVANIIAWKAIESHKEGRVMPLELSAFA